MKLAMKDSIMFYERTIKLVAIFTFILVVLVLAIGINKSEILALLGVESSAKITSLLVNLLGVLAFVLLYCAFSIISSKIGLHIFSALNDDRYLSIYRMYKYIVTKEARTAWENGLRNRGLIN